MTFFELYPYLVFSSVLFIIFLAFLLIYKKQWQPMLVSGLLSAPFAYTSVFFVPEYWDPTRIAVFVAGPEDIIFSFANGGIVWLIATWPVRKRIILQIQTGRSMMRYVFCSVFGVTFGAAFILILHTYGSGVGIMTAALVTITSLGVLLLYLRSEFWPISIAGGIGFTILYTILVGIVFTIHPDVVLQWNIDNLWGIKLLGIPMEEILWAFLFGAVWPLLMAYVFDVSLDFHRPVGRKTTIDPYF